MKTGFPDILHSFIHVVHKCFTCQKIAKLPQITELERVLNKQKKLVQKDREINLFWLCICYKSILLIIKNKKHLHNIGRMHTKDPLKDIAILKIFTGSALSNRK